MLTDGSWYSGSLDEVVILAAAAFDTKSNKGFFRCFLGMTSDFGVAQKDESLSCKNDFIPPVFSSPVNLVADTPKQVMGGDL